MRKSPLEEDPGPGEQEATAYQRKASGVDGVAAEGNFK
jgi:hypothetical protein